MKEFTIVYLPSKVYRVTPGKNPFAFHRSTVSGLSLQDVIKHLEHQTIEKRNFGLYLSSDAPTEDQQILKERFSKLPKFSGLSLVDLTIQRHQKL